MSPEMCVSVDPGLFGPDLGDARKGAGQKGFAGSRKGAWAGAPCRDAHAMAAGDEGQLRRSRASGIRKSSAMADRDGAVDKPASQGKPYFAEDFCGGCPQDGGGDCASSCYPICRPLSMRRQGARGFGACPRFGRNPGAQKRPGQGPQGARLTSLSPPSLPFRHSRYR